MPALLDTARSYQPHSDIGGLLQLSRPAGSGSGSGQSATSTPIFENTAPARRLVHFAGWSPRYYHPTTGRFLQRDPIEDSTGDPYGYAGRDPVNNTDPDGLLCLGNTCLGFHPGAGANAIVNIGRGASGGLTDDVANMITPGASCTVDQNELQKGIGLAGSLVTGAGGVRAARAAKEPMIGGTRLAPFGNSSGHPIGRFPHYHRSTPNPARPGESLPGQGIGRHRPWESKGPDTSFWDRF